MYQPLIKFHPYPAIITQVLTIFVEDRMRLEIKNIRNEFRYFIFLSSFPIFVKRESCCVAVGFA